MVMLLRGRRDVGDDVIVTGMGGRRRRAPGGLRMTRSACRFSKGSPVGGGGFIERGWWVVPRSEQPRLYHVCCARCGLRVEAYGRSMAVRLVRQHPHIEAFAERPERRERAGVRLS